MTKIALQDYNGAIQDFSKAIESNPKDAIAFFNRGLAKMGLNLRSEACSDFRQAQNLGLSKATDVIKKLCY